MGEVEEGAALLALAREDIGGDAMLSGRGRER